MLEHCLTFLLWLVLVLIMVLGIAPAQESPEEGQESQVDMKVTVTPPPILNSPRTIGDPWGPPAPGVSAGSGNEQDGGGGTTEREIVPFPYVLSPDQDWSVAL